MKLDVFRKIASEDFAKEDQAFVKKLLYPLNKFFESVILAFNKNITFSENIQCQLKSISVTVDASGIPTSNITFTSTLPAIIQGIVVYNALNNTSNAALVSAPFIEFSENKKIVKINHITGLTTGEDWTLSLLLF